MESARVRRQVIGVLLMGTVGACTPKQGGTPPSPSNLLPEDPARKSWEIVDAANDKIYLAAGRNFGALKPLPVQQNPQIADKLDKSLKAFSREGVTPADQFACSNKGCMTEVYFKDEKVFLAFDGDLRNPRKSDYTSWPHGNGRTGLLKKSNTYMAAYFLMAKMPKEDGK
jgi:hypothetical protein